MDESYALRQPYCQPVTGALHRLAFHAALQESVREPAQFSWAASVQYAVFLPRLSKAPINGLLALYNEITKQRSARHTRRAWQSAVCLKPQFSWKVVMILCREPTEPPAEPTTAFRFVSCRPKIRLQEMPCPWRAKPPRSLLFSMPSAAEK